MVLVRVFLVLILVGGPAACSSKFTTYNGPEVTRVVVYKDRHRMYLMHHDKVLKTYRIALGFEPRGHKRFQGDGKTPEGNYIINRRNPNSEFYLSIGISYPNATDRAHARAVGRDPGGDIFIHGGRRKGDPKRPDWTAGCISVPDHKMRDIYAMVRNGTPITILP